MKKSEKREECGSSRVIDLPSFAVVDESGHIHNLLTIGTYFPSNYALTILVQLAHCALSEKASAATGPCD